MAPGPDTIRPRPVGTGGDWFDVADPRADPVGPIVAIWLAWLALAAVLLRSHEPWRDELQAWAMARSVDNPLELFGYIRGEGHPPGWQLLLWLPARVAPGTATLQIVALALAAVAAWLILRHMPLSLGLRALVVFGYFPLFELSTVARNYVLAYACVVVALWLAHRPGTHRAWVAAALLGAVGASATTVPLVVAMALGLWGGRWWASPRRHPAHWAWVAAVTLPLVAAAIVVRPSRGSRATLAIDQAGPDNLWSSLAAPLRALAPFSPTRTSFWGGLTVTNWGWWASLAGLAVVVVMAIAVRHSLSALSIWLVSTMGFVLLVTATGEVLAPRTVSAVWMGALATVWVAAADRLARQPATRRPVPWPVVAGASLLLAAGLWAGAWATWAEVTTPFSSAEGAAQWVREESTGDVTILCAANRALCSSVAIRLNVPAYTAADSQPFTFVEWNPGWARTLPLAAVASNAATLEQQTGKQVFIVAPEFGFPPGCERGWVTGETITSERLRVCRADQLTTP